MDIKVPKIDCYIVTHIFNLVMGLKLFIYMIDYLFIYLSNYYELVKINYLFIKIFTYLLEN